MPMNRADYPADWEDVSRFVRFERAGGRCEWPGCEAPHGRHIRRSVHNAEVFIAEPDYLRLPPALQHGYADRPIKVVLTTAHTCECSPLCSDPAHLRGYCQLHHLRLDAKQHATNSRATRARKADARRALLGAEPCSTK